MNKSDLITLYQKQTPLRSTHPTHSDHVKRIKEHRDPSGEYDRCILLARKQKGRDVANMVWKSITRPRDLTPAQWKTRKPTLYDVDALDSKADRWLDPVTEQPLLRDYRIKAADGELSKAEYYHLATVLFGDPDAAKCSRLICKAEHGVMRNAIRPSETPYFIDSKPLTLGESGTPLPEGSKSDIIEAVEFHEGQRIKMDSGTTLGFAQVYSPLIDASRILEGVFTQ